MSIAGLIDQLFTGTAAMTPYEPDNFRFAITRVDDRLENGLFLVAERVARDFLS